MALTIPAYNCTTKEEAGIQYACDKWNEKQLAKEPPGQTKSVLQFWLMAARSLVNQWYIQSVEASADAQKLATIAANPPDFVPATDLNP